MKPNRFLTGRSAIYGIRNIVNGKLYIGKTKCMYKRCQQYKYDFEAARSYQLNRYLLAAMQKIGFDKFEMFVLEFCPVKKLAERELFWMKKFNTLDRNMGYNLRFDSSSGMNAHAETRAKISRNLKRQWANGIRDGHSKKLKRAWKNADPLRSKEQAERFRKSRTKFEYTVLHPDGTQEICAYLRIKELGIPWAVGNMSRSGKNETVCNGFKITRYPIGER